MEFRKYQHIERLGNKEVQGILEGDCFIFFKLDGMNGSVFMKDGELCIGKRNGVIDLEQKADRKFHEFIFNNKDKYIEFFKAYPGMRLYGEFMIPHTIKTYRDDVWDQFYVFDVTRDDGEFEHLYIPYTIYAPLLENFEIPFIPASSHKNPTFEALMDILENKTKYVNEGTEEGIVIKNYSFINRYGRTVWGKLVNEDTMLKKKSKKDPNKIMKKIDTEDNSKEEDFIETKCTAEFVLKEFNKLKLEDEAKALNPKIRKKVLFIQIYEVLILEEIANYILSKDMNKLNLGSIKKYLSLKLKDMELENLFN